MGPHTNLLVAAELSGDELVEEEDNACISCRTRMPTASNSSARGNEAMLLSLEGVEDAVSVVLVAWLNVDAGGVE